jgi:hypothetical protein
VTRERISGFLFGIGVGTAIAYFLKPQNHSSGEPASGAGKPAVTRERISGALLGAGVGTTIAYFLKPQNHRSG